MYKTIISANELSRLIEAGHVAVFDCSFDLADPSQGARDYASGHLPGARYLHLDQDLSSPSGEGGRHPLPLRDKLAAKLAAEGLRAGQQVVAYDRSGGWFAARLWWLLRWLGHDDVAVLDGGLGAWTAAGLPLETETDPATPGDFSAAPAPGAPVADVDAVLANLTSRERLVIDSRSPERYAGLPNPADPVAGRIPGAANRFFQDNLAADGTFRSRDELRLAFERAAEGLPAERLILQCGSGVTACHNLLAMEIAGMRGAALYPGSWSEWISDPARPIERDERASG